MRLLALKQSSGQKTRARRVCGHRIGADLRHQPWIGAKQRSANENADRRIDRGRARRLNGAAERFDARAGAQGQAHDSEAFVRHGVRDILRSAFFSQIDLPGGVTHETGNHIESEVMPLAGQRTEQNALASVRASWRVSGVKFAQNSLEARHADCHFDEGATVVFPQNAKMTGGLGHQAEEEGFLRVAAVTHLLEILFYGVAVIVDQRIGEVDNLPTTEGAFGVSPRKIMMQQMQSRDDIVDDHRSKAVPRWIGASRKERFGVVAAVGRRT